MSNQIGLIYPTIELFLYDLKEGLGQDEENVNSNRQHFWSKIHGDKLDSKTLAELKQAEKDSPEYLPLLTANKNHLQPFALPINGYYYPVQLGDTYALQVDCSGTYQPERKTLVQPISYLQDIYQQILSHVKHSKGKLGQTWLIWGQLATDNQNFEATAKACHQQLQIVPQQDWNRDLRGKGEFFGGKIFELWRLPSEWQQMNDGYHLLICLFPQQQSIDDIGKNMSILYPQLLRLLSYRHKVLWAYGQSRNIKNSLKQVAKLVQNIVSSLSIQAQNPGIDINQLQQQLAITPAIILKYTNNLSYLDDQRRTMKVNINNYEIQWRKLQMLDNHSDWQFCQEFSELAQEKFLPQIETDYANLSPELTLLENSIKTIQGIIDIEQTKSDRTLNSSIAIAGIGLATSQIASAVFLAELPTKTKNPLAYQTQTFFISLSIGLIAAMLTYILLRAFRRK